jgi:Domain of unknown function (DUF4328)/Protein of unknown function (DUF2510)
VSDELSGYPGAPPGWYPDPAGGPGQRWWDGYAWTEATVLPAVPPPPPEPPEPPPQAQTSQTPHWTSAQTGYGPPPGYPGYAGAPGPGMAAGALAPPLVDRELALSQWARVAFAVPAAYYLANLISERVYRTQFLRQGHHIRLVWEAAQHHTTAPPFDSSSSTLNPITTIVGLLTIAAVVVASIWQYRAATAARSLGFPALRSPGWGVGSWFVPIVNFWMPYQALRDCLPPGDPHRRLVLRWWLTWLALEVFGGAAAIAAFFSSGVALGLGIPAAVLCVALAAVAPQVIAAIGAAHQAAVAPPAGA